MSAHSFQGTAPKLGRTQSSRFLSMGTPKNRRDFSSNYKERDISPMQFGACHTIGNRHETYKRVRKCMIRCVQTFIDLGGEHFELLMSVVTCHTLRT